MTKVNSSALHGQLLADEKLAKYTSWRVGGAAEQVYIPADKHDLIQFITSLSKNEQVFWLGLGSNLLVRDGGITGTVVNTRGKLKELTLLGNDHIYVECGVPCAHVARFCAKNGLVGAEFLAGIPGTMGGAIKMNAGAFGGETWRLIASIETISAGGELVQHASNEFIVAYRHVEGLHNDCILSANLRLKQGDSQEVQQKIKKLLAQRSASQPTNQPTCGSVFKNPKHDYAARLIEVSGLKGYAIGGAQVSHKHANFIVNTGEATAQDIEQLIEYVQQTVDKRQGIKLQTEVCIVGEILA